MVLHLRAQGLGEGDEHPPTLSCGARSTLPYRGSKLPLTVMCVSVEEVESGQTSLTCDVSAADSVSETKLVSADNDDDLSLGAEGLYTVKIIIIQG